MLITFLQKTTYFDFDFATYTFELKVLMKMIYRLMRGRILQLKLINARLNHVRFFTLLLFFFIIAA